MAQITQQAAPASLEKTGMRRVWASQKFQDRLLTTVCTILCIVGVVIILFPAGWMLSTSLKTRFEAVQFPPTLFPIVPQWNNYVVALTSNPFLKYFQNTMYYCITYMVVETIAVAFIAYGFARLRAPGKD